VRIGCGKCSILREYAGICEGVSALIQWFQGFQLNEVIEFAATLLVPETNVGGYLNTGWDLVANLFGATVAVTAIWISDRSTPPEETEGE